MELLPFTNEKLKETVLGLKNLSSIVPNKNVLVDSCKSLGWSMQSADRIVLEFESPCKSTFFVDLYNNNSVAGGFVALCFLDWDEYDGSAVESKKSQEIFDHKYLEIVSIAKDLLGEPKLTVTEPNAFQKSSIWQQENALIFVIQGADDIEGLDIRLWLEYVDGSIDVPNSGIFDWLCQRHLSKLND